MNKNNSNDDCKINVNYFVIYCIITYDFREEKKMKNPCIIHYFDGEKYFRKLLTLIKKTKNTIKLYTLRVNFMA